MIRMPIQQMIPYHHQYPRNTATTAPKKENENTQGLSFHEILQQKWLKRTQLLPCDKMKPDCIEFDYRTVLLP